MVLGKHDTPQGVSMVVPCLTLPGIETLFEWSRLADEVCLIMKSNSSNLKISSSQKLRIYPQKQLGLSGALNQGIESAKYQFVRRMDSTDRIAPGSIEKQLALIENNNFDLVYDLAKNRVLGFSFQPFTGKPDGHTVPRWAFIFCNPVIHPSVMASRRWFINNSYQNVTCEDFELWTRTALSTSIYCTGSIGLEYDRRASQKSASVTLNSSDLAILTKNLRDIIEYEFRFRISEESLNIWVSAIFSRDKSQKSVDAESFVIFFRMFAQLKNKTTEMPMSIRSYYENYLLIAKLRFILRARIDSRSRMRLLFQNFGLHELKLIFLLLIKRIWLELFIKLDYLIN